MTTTSMRLLDAEPALADGVEPALVAAAREVAVATVVTLETGSHGHAGGGTTCLIVAGVVGRERGGVVQVATPGDVLPLRGAAWTVLLPAQVMVLDDLVLHAGQQSPWLAARLLERAAAWADRALELQEIARLPRVPERLFATLWHLADRCGRVRADGVWLGLPLTHGAVGRIVGAARPTVSLALAELEARGSVVPHPEGWLLPHEHRPPPNARGTALIARARQATAGGQAAARASDAVRAQSAHAVARSKRAKARSGELT